MSPALEPVQGAFPLAAPRQLGCLLSVASTAHGWLLASPYVAHARLLSGNTICGTMCLYSIVRQTGVQPTSLRPLPQPLQIYPVYSSEGTSLLTSPVSTTGFDIVNGTAGIRFLKSFMGLGDVGWNSSFAYRCPSGVVLGLDVSCSGLQSGACCMTCSSVG